MLKIKWLIAAGPGEFVETNRKTELISDIEVPGRQVKNTSRTHIEFRMPGGTLVRVPKGRCQKIWLDDNDVVVDIEDYRDSRMIYSER